MNFLEITVEKLLMLEVSQIFSANRRYCLGSFGPLLALLFGCTSLPLRQNDPVRLPANDIARDSDLKVVLETANDAIPWQFTSQPRIVAIGDIHGDLDALLSILSRSDLIDDQGHWVGGQTHLVIDGDLVNKGPHSRSALDFVIALESEMRAKGEGNLHFLLGNHEVMLASGVTHSSSAEDLIEMKSQAFLQSKPEWSLKQVESVEELFRSNSIYGEFLERQNAITQIGDTIFVHAGLGSWAQEFEFKDINATARAWMKYYTAGKTFATRPPPGTEWVVGELNQSAGIEDNNVGPIFGKEMAPRDAHPEKKRRFKFTLSDEELTQLLRQRNANRVVIGHIPAGPEVQNHPYYDSKVLMIDTRISRWSDKSADGSLGWIEIDDRGTVSKKTASMTPEVMRNGHPVRKLFSEKISTQTLKALGGCKKSLHSLLKTFGK